MTVLFWLIRKNLVYNSGFKKGFVLFLRSTIYFLCFGMLSTIAGMLIRLKIALALLSIASIVGKNPI